MDLFLSHLASFCRTHITQNKWVFVPSLALGHTLGERLALTGEGWANLRFLTPDEVARQIAAPFLVAQGINPTTDGIGSALMMQLLLNLPSHIPAYFRPMAHRPELADALWRSIQELRMTNLTAATFTSSSFPHGAKREELTALLQAYEQYLSDAKLVDRAGIMKEALEHLEHSPIHSGDYCFELPDILWPPLHRHLLDELPGNKITIPALSLPGLARPRRSRLLSAQNPVTPEPTTDAERLAFLLAPSTSPPTKNDGTVHLFRAGSREGEVEEVFRRILASQTPLDQVELACASQDTSPLVWQKAARYDWPITIGPGLPIVLTRPARAFLAFCTWIQRGFPAEGLRRLLQSGDLHLGLDGDPSEGQAARLLAQSGPTWGRLTYDRALQAFITRARERAENPDHDTETRTQAEQQAQRARRLAEWIAQLFHSIPDATSRDTTLEPWLETMATFIEHCTAVDNDLDAAARTAMGQALAELRVIAALPRTATESLDLICKTIESLHVASDRARSGHLHVTTLYQAGYSGRPFTFILDLEEGVVLRASIEDPIVLDTERTALSIDLPTSQDRTTEALHAIVSRLAALQGSVTMSFACCETKEYHETFPSWLVLQAIRVLHPGRPWTYEALQQTLDNPVSVVPARPEMALSDAGWWLSTTRRRGSETESAVLQAFPWLHQGTLAQAARGSDQFTVYDGLVRAAGAALDPRRTGRPVSITQLEQFAACPFRYFLRHALRIQAPEEATPDPDVWLDPLTRGRLLHALYAEIWGECSARQECLDPGRHGTRFIELAEEHLTRLRQDMPPPSEQVYEREREALRRDLDLFLRLEQSTPGRRPVGHEVAFGSGSDGEDPLASSEPITITLPDGSSFQLRGRLDRLDHLSDGTYEVVDYKTGVLRLTGGLAAIYAGGRQLQHALYVLAARELLRRQNIGGHVQGGSYYFPTLRGGGERISRPLSDSRPALNVLGDLFAVMAAGVFANTQDPQTCGYCTFQRACGDTPWGRMVQKIPNTHNTVLAPLIALTSHA